MLVIIHGESPKSTQPEPEYNNNSWGINILLFDGSKNMHIFFSDWSLEELDD